MAKNKTKKKTKKQMVLDKTNYICKLKEYGWTNAECAKRVGVSTRTLETVIAEEPEFRVKYQEAQAIRAASYQDKLHDRLINGKRKEVIQYSIDENGNEVAIGKTVTIEDESPNLLSFALRNALPSEYNRDKILDVKVETNELDPIYDLINTIKGEDVDE